MLISTTERAVVIKEAYGVAPLHVCSMFTEVLTAMKYGEQMEATKKNYYLNAHSSGNRCESFAH